MTLAALVPTTLGATEDTRVFAWTRSLRDAPADVAARVQASTTLGRFGIAWPVMWSLRAHRGAEKGPQK